MLTFHYISIYIHGKFRTFHCQSVLIWYSVLIVHQNSCNKYFELKTCGASHRGVIKQLCMVQRELHAFSNWTADRVCTAVAQLINIMLITAEWDKLFKMMSPTTVFASIFFIEMISHTQRVIFCFYLKPLIWNIRINLITQ